MQYQWLYFYIPRLFPSFIFQSTISFSLTEHGFTPLSNVCQPILSNVRESRLRLRKPASNVKLVCFHASPVYASSVSGLVKPLSISKPVCSSNVTKRNVCNASSVSQLIKPLNAGKPVCSSKATKHNVFNASSVSQLTKPSNNRKLYVQVRQLNIMTVWQ